MNLFHKATVSSFKLDGEYERTLTAEIDTANEIIWLTKVSVDGSDTETMCMPFSFDDLKTLNKLMEKVGQ